MKKLQSHFSLALCMVLLLTQSFFLSGCVVSYSGYHNPAKMSSPGKSGRLLYDIKGGSVAGGTEAIKRTLETEAPFQSIEYIRVSREGGVALESLPKDGIFVNVKVMGVPPSIPSMVCAYVSLLTLTFFPAGSFNSGNDIVFEVYKNGQFVKSYSYQVRRKAFMWIVALPFFWVNFLTPSESEVFTFVTRTFFQDASDVLRS